jgi:hypothetical protein
MVCGAVFTATASGVPLWQQARASRARADAVAVAQSARMAMRLAMQDALDPFVELLSQLASVRPRQKPLLRGEAIQLALSTIAQLGLPGGVTAPEVPSRLRVCYFALDEGPPQRLVLRAYAGRSGAPAVSLDRTTRGGQFLLRICGDGWVTIDDVDDLRVPVWWDEEHRYRTFTAGPVVRAGNEPIGLVLIDALAPGELTTLDLPLVRIVTHLLALALQI